MAIYTTRQGDMIDAICRRQYGDESGYVEKVLDANPGLAALGSPLPDRTKINLPDEPNVSASVPVVSLWD